jgi:RND family efflux transporter MFP subunit
MRPTGNASIVVLLFILICLSAVFGCSDSGKIQPGKTEPISGLEKAPSETATAQIKLVRRWFEASGTVRPRTETRIEAQVTAQVISVDVHPGSRVTKGQVLVSLDNRQLLARLDQARQGLKSAQATRKQAQQAVISAQAAYDEAAADFKRTKTYFESEAATQQTLEKAQSLYSQAKAGLARAKEAQSGAMAGIKQAEEVVREAEIAMGYTRIVAPETGEVLKRLVEPGDLALPGKPLLVLQTAGAYRLEAHVREGLISMVRLGMQLPATIATLEKKVQTDVEEIIPYADPQTRTFLVKAALPPISGLYPGMFGKLRIPVLTENVVVIPADALRKVGQLELVTVKEGDRWTRRYIKTGRRLDQQIEVLSGLKGDETIGLN